MASTIEVSVVEKGKKSPDWKITNDLDGTWTLNDLLKFAKNALITISSDVLKEEQAKGFDKNPILLVDGKFGTSVDNVKPLGKIQYIAKQNVKNIVMFAYEAVLKRSPEDTGRYLNSNVVTYNGNQVANNLQGLKSWLARTEFGEKDKIRIVNTAPYARKLELQGVRKGVRSPKMGKFVRGSTQRPNQNGQIKKPNGAYTLATKAIKAKYGKAVFIKFELLLGSTIGLVGAGRVRKTGKDIGRPYVYPSILIWVFDASGPT
jgi:hypothetical protein